MLELICQNAELWHCDPEKIALMGFSAGGHLAAHYANAYDIPQVRSAFPHSKGVQASLLCYPVISSREELRHAESFQNLTGMKGQRPMGRGILRKTGDRENTPHLPVAYGEGQCCPCFQQPGVRTGAGRARGAF